MRTSILSAIACAIALTAATVAGAQPGVSDDWRDGRDSWRMREGYRSGLTRAERARIRLAQLRVQRLQRRALADGVITPRERQRIMMARFQLRRLAYRLRRDVDFGRGWRSDDWRVG